MSIQLSLLCSTHVQKYSRITLKGGSGNIETWECQHHGSDPYVNSEMPLDVLHVYPNICTCAHMVSTFLK